MITIPSLKRLKSQTQLDYYSETYLKCSGLPIPQVYINNPDNRVYGIFYNNKMIGGFILGKGQTLRTLEVFAQPDARRRLYDSVGEIHECTEITCFWIDPKFRKNPYLNTYTWICLAIMLKCVGNKKVIFGTCSASLAKLYSTTSKSVLIHKDVVNGKPTFIFRGDQQVSLIGFFEVLRHKWSRMARVSWRQARA